MSARLRPLIRPGVDLVIVGTEPGATSLRLGQYYANPNNSFYADLALVGLTPRQLAPHEFRDLLTNGIGLDDVYDDPRALWQRLARIAPLVVCFNSKQALERFSGVKIGRRPWRGGNAREIIEIAEVTWALDDSSSTARAYHHSRIDGLRGLDEALEQARADTPRHRAQMSLKAEDLRRLLGLELEWRRELESGRRHWRLYSDRLIAICLAQGAAKHLIDGKTGIKDFDLYRIFAATDERPQPDPAIYRGRTVKDFGASASESAPTGGAAVASAASPGATSTSSQLHSLLTRLTTQAPRYSTGSLSRGREPSARSLARPSPYSRMVRRASYGPLKPPGQRCADSRTNTE